MGRAIHTNLRAEFSCDAVKLAMIKNGRLAHKIFKGKLYDCVFAVRVFDIPLEDQLESPLDPPFELELF